MNTCLSAVDFQCRTGSGIAVGIVTIHFYKLLLSCVEQSVVYHLTAQSTKFVWFFFGRWGGDRSSWSRHGVLHAPFSGCVSMGKKDTGYGGGPKLYCLLLLGYFTCCCQQSRRDCINLVLCCGFALCFRGNSVWLPVEGRRAEKTSASYRLYGMGQQNLTFGLPSIKAENGSPVVEGEA